jgi:hypothetical protein
VVALVEDVSSKGPLAGIVLSFVLTSYSGAYEDVNLADLVPTSARRLVWEIAARCPPPVPPVPAPMPWCRSWT